MVTLVITSDPTFSSSMFQTQSSFLSHGNNVLRRTQDTSKNLAILIQTDGNENLILEELLPLLRLIVAFSAVNALL